VRRAREKRKETERLAKAERRADAEHQAHADPQPGTGEPADPQPNAEWDGTVVADEVEKMVEATGGEATGSGGAVVRASDSSGGLVVVIHDKTAALDANALLVVYRRDLLAHNTGAVEQLDVMERSLAVSAFGLCVGLIFFL
jgi:type II secretory pathway component GspD/PulD (secretin)